MPGGEEYSNSERREGDQLELIKNRTLWEAFQGPQIIQGAMHTHQDPGRPKNEGGHGALWFPNTQETPGQGETGEFCQPPVVLHDF